MTTHAAGPFTVKLAPIPAYNSDPHALLGRMSIDKTFTGDLDATSQGEMLTAGGGVTGSAGYVAVERVTGTLHGRQGSFALLHRGIMDRGAPSLSVTVVPDSGTGALEGLRGSMQIIREAGAHAYTFDYELGEATAS